MTAADDYRITRAARIDDDEAGPAGLGQLEEDAPAGTSLRDVATETAPQRKLYGRRARVTLAGPDGEPLEPFEVRIDNRDYLRWDKTAPRQKWGSGRDVPFLMATFLSWSAATRAGLTDLKWPQFEEACLEAENLEQSDEDAADPTR